MGITSAIFKQFENTPVSIHKLNKLLITLVNKKNFFIGASNIRAVLEYIWGADSENDGGFFASALVFEIRYTAHICLLVNLCREFTSMD